MIQQEVKYIWPTTTWSVPLTTPAKDGKSLLDLDLDRLIGQGHLLAQQRQFGSEYKSVFESLWVAFRPPRPSRFTWWGDIVRRLAAYQFAGFLKAIKQTDSVVGRPGAEEKGSGGGAGGSPGTGRPRQNANVSIFIS